MHLSSSHPSDSGKSPRKIGDGAPVDEIEITPEMIEAGIDACAYWDSCDLDEWRVIDIYREMERARRAPNRSLKFAST
jgi:hypothetical protein